MARQVRQEPAAAEQAGRQRDAKQRWRRRTVSHLEPRVFRPGESSKGGRKIGRLFLYRWRLKALTRKNMRPKSTVSRIAIVLGVVALGLVWWQVAIARASAQEAQLRSGLFRLRDALDDYVAKTGSCPARLEDI